MSELLAYHWPGNMRELDAEMQKVVYFASIDEPYRPLFTKRSDLNVESKQMAKTREGFVDSEKQEIILALNKHRFNVSRAAKEIGMARTTMLWKMKRYGIDG